MTTRNSTLRNCTEREKEKEMEKKKKAQEKEEEKQNQMEKATGGEKRLVTSYEAERIRGN